MNTLLQDLCFAARQLRRSPGFTLVAVLTLALGIGATTTVFSAVDRLLLNPLPFRGSDRMVFLWRTDPRAGVSTSPPAAVAQAWTEQAHTLDGVGAYTFGRVYLGGTAEPAMLNEAQVSPSFLSFLGVQPALGRMFGPNEARPGGEPVVLISYELWQRRFGGNKDVLGRSVTLDGTPHTIIGVMPALLRRFDPREGSDVWTPLRPAAPDADAPSFWSVVARLRPGIAPGQAERELSAIMARVPAEPGPSPLTWRAKVMEPQELFGGSLHDPLLMLSAAVGVVLLIACANLAHLLIARGMRREREIAVRAALGAGRGRLVVQLLVEALLLAALGGGLGLLLAWWGVGTVARLHPESLPELAQIELDARVLGFGMGLSLLTGLVFGLLPALTATRLDLRGVLQRGGTGTVGAGGGMRLRSALMVGEVALSVVLLAGAGLLVRSLLHLQGTDPGFQPERVATARVTFPTARYPTPAARDAVLNELVRRARALPGVESATLAQDVPPRYGITFGALEIGGRQIAGGAPSTFSMNWVQPDYFRVLGVPLLKGRGFTAEEQRTGASVMVISDRMARRFWPGASPLGARLRLGPQGEWQTVVGVAGSVLANGQIRSGDDLQLYSPFEDTGVPRAVLAVRARGDAAALLPTLCSLVRSVDPTIPVPEVATAESLLSDSLSPSRFNTTLLLALAALALTLAAVGLFGVLSYAVEQRRREIGIRMALGAGSGQVVRLILRFSMIVVATGSMIGLVGAWAATRLMRSLLHGVSATDPASFAAAVLLLAGVALLASYLPARRATRVDPMVALRAE